MQARTIELRFELREPGAMGIAEGVHVALQEDLLVEFDQGLWKVTNPAGHLTWIGRQESYQGAICEYLKSRLGIEEK
jgi:hypothetical protein